MRRRICVVRRTCEPCTVVMFTPPSEPVTEDTSMPTNLAPRPLYNADAPRLLEPVLVREVHDADPRFT